MICPNCKAELSGDYEVCVYCGKKLPKKMRSRWETDPADSQTSFEGKKLSKGVIALIIVLVVAVLAAGGTYAAVRITDPAPKYQKAIRWMEEGKYQQADAMFQDLSGYEDADALRKENRFLWAEDLLEKEEYDTAYEYLRELGSFKNARELIRRSKYERALALIRERDYGSACKLLEDISSYEDAAALLAEYSDLTADAPVTEAPETTTKTPETTTKAPETTKKAPETTKKAPETTTKAPETTTRVPETTRAPEPTERVEAPSREMPSPYPNTQYHTTGAYYVYAEGDGLRMRSMPSTDSIAVIVAPDDTVLNITEVVLNNAGEYWGKAYYGGVVGYFYMGYLFPVE